ncbi:MAG: sugar phosphate isomerase/epimerase, partial [Chloroflexi bacterium]|nr:sugar phosphate isomerase/epimerase [Chloroflexota bacterium]
MDEHCASKLAVQMYTIREFTGTPSGLAESLKKIRAIGYPAVQLSAVGAMAGEGAAVSAGDARRMLDDNGLRCIATHRAWDSLANRTDDEIDFHRTLGCDYTAIGGLPAPYNDEGADGYRRFVENSAPIIARLKAGGVRFGYHNHAHEFQRIEGSRRTWYDILIDDGGADFTMELDVYWAVHAGANPVRILDRCQGRAPVIHLKDKEVVAREGPVMAAIGEGNLD